jgi:DNA-binding NtrC family response regulator
VEERQPHIVLVEDDADIRELFSMVLRQAGYAVMPFEHGQTALAALQAMPCDLFITDYHLPDTRGNLLVIYVRAAYPRLATMLISGESDVQHLASLCGADAWFRKGEPLDRFLEKVATVCAPEMVATVRG